MDREQLMASLLAGDEDVDRMEVGDAGYIDWAFQPADLADGRNFALSDDGKDECNVNLSWSQIERLQRALTLTLLNRTD